MRLNSAWSRCDKSKYLPWLEYGFYDRACAYCLEHARVLEVDHVEPVSLAPDRERDPTNLLPACAMCNGATGKWDYHPLRSPRRKCPTDEHGFLPLDPRSDDYAQLYRVEEDGRLEVRVGPGSDRALWNSEVLFRLNRKGLRQWREQTQQLARVAEHLVRVVATEDPQAVRRRDVMVREVGRRLLFFEVLELELSPALRALAEAIRAAEREIP